MRVSSSSIHSTAMVDPSAELAPDVEVGPYAIIGPRATIGPGCKIAAHAIIGPDTRMGENNQVHHHAVLGTDSQDLKFKGEATRLEIGDNNVFREFVTLNRATREGCATRIGSGCLMLAYTHVAHNTRIGNEVVIANAAQVGGEVVVEDRVGIGGLVGVHQFSRIGTQAFVGACSKVTQDIVPYVRADGHPARPRGLNTIGMKRREVPPDTIGRIKAAYRTLFLGGIRLEEALETLTRDFADSPEVMHMVQFIRTTTRNIARPRGQSFEIDGPS